MSDFLSTQDETFLDILSKFVPQKEDQLEFSEYESDDHLKIKYFFLEFSTRVKGKTDSEIMLNSGISALFQYIISKINSKSNGSKSLLLNFINNFLIFLVGQRENSEYINMVLNEAKIYVKRKKSVNTKNLLIFQKIYVVCKFIQEIESNEEYKSYLDVRDILFLPDEHFALLFSFFSNFQPEVTPLLLSMTFPYYFIDTKQYEGSDDDEKPSETLKEMINKEIFFLPDPYGIISYPTNFFTDDRVIIHIIQYSRYIFNNIVKNGINTSNAAYLSKLLSSGALCRGSFTLYLLLMGSIPKFIPYFVDFFGKMDSRAGAAILRQLCLYNTTEAFKILLKNLPAYISQNYSSMKFSSLEQDVITAILSFSKWTDFPFEILSLTLTKDSMQTTRVFSLYLTFLSTNQKKIYELTPFIDDFCGSLLERLKEISELLSDNINMTNPLMVDLICNLCEQFLIFISKFSDRDFLYIVGEDLLTLTFKAIDFVFFSRVNDSHGYIQVIITRLMDCITNFIQENDSFYVKLMQNASYEPYLFSYSYICSIIGAQKHWDNVLKHVILSESTVGFYCATQMFTKKAGFKEKIQSLLSAFMDFCVSSSKNCSRELIIKAISKILLLIAITFQDIDRFALLSASPFFEPLMILLKDTVIALSRGLESQQEKERSLAKEQIMFLNSCVIFYSELIKNAKEVYHRFIPIEELFGFFLYYQKEAANAMLNLLVSFMDKYRIDKPPLFIKWTYISHSNASNKLMFLKRFKEFYPSSRVPIKCISYMKEHSNGEVDMSEISEISIPFLPWKSFPKVYDVFEDVTYIFKVKPQQ